MGGYVSCSRVDYRAEYGRAALTDGDGYGRRSCGQDAVYMACYHLHMTCISRAAIYSDLPPHDEHDTPIDDLINCSRRLWMVNWVRIRNISRQKGGPGYALFNIRIGVYIVLLDVRCMDGTVDHHCVVYVAHQEGGVLLDNDPRCDVIFIQDHDRESPERANAVWHGLFPESHSVRVTAAYHMIRII